MNETIDQNGNLVYFTNLQPSPMVQVSGVELKRKKYVIAAVDLDGGYAKEGEIPWYYPEDFKWFKQQTDGNICVMGKNTYLDITKRLGDKSKDSVLPNRTCYVVSSTLTDITNATVIPSLGALDTLLDPEDLRKVFVIGGGQLFEEAIQTADIALITVINDTHQCDAFFPVDNLLTNYVSSAVYKGTADKLRYVVFNRK